MNAEIREANRYLTNAKEILSQKAGKENGAYTDKKYVRMAGHTAYMGVLHALDQLILPHNKKRRNSMEHYQIFLSKYDRKLLSDFNDIYNVLHLSLGYDGVLNSKIVNEGMAMAKEFIQKIATRVN
jgi:hypothetical protein